MTKGRRFQNQYPHSPHRLRDVLRWKLGFGPRESERVAPSPDLAKPPQLLEPDWKIIANPDPDKLQVTWIGHATFLIQVSGCHWLTDPIFSSHCGPFPIPQGRRLIPPALPWDRVPRVDGVLISHAHYDHMDWPTLKRLDRRTAIYVPTGLRSWFRRRSFVNTHELGWWESREARPGWKLIACPAQHFSARSPWDWNRALWCGWLLETPAWKIYFAGDTGYCPVFREISERFGGLDLALLPIGAYAPRRLMNSMHTDPFEAARMHLDLGTRYSVPGHWGTFPLTDELPGEPAVLLDRARHRYRIPESAFPILRPGQTLSIDRRTSGRSR